MRVLKFNIASSLAVLLALICTAANLKFCLDTEFYAAPKFCIAIKLHHLSAASGAMQNFKP